MKIFVYSFLAVYVVISFPAAYAKPAQGTVIHTYLNILGPLPDSKAYKLYQKRPKSEFSKLLFLMDRFRHSDAKLIYDGRQFEPREALKTVKQYIVKHYDRKSDAKKWVEKHAYRSEGSGQIIYMKFDDQPKQILRDVLIGELEKLEAIDQ